MHVHQSNYRNKVVKVKSEANEIGGQEILIEDWWDRVFGKSWKVSDHNPAAINYAIRTGLSKDIQIPFDDEVLYGKINGLGYLVHMKELEL